MEKGGGREQEGAKEGDHDHHDDEDDNHDDQDDNDHDEYDQCTIFFNSVQNFLIVYTIWMYRLVVKSVNKDDNAAFCKILESAGSFSLCSQQP